jgi:hypothetical protein
MTYDHLDLEQSAGARQIQAYCDDVSQALGLELKSVWWRWLSTAPAGSARHGLDVEATIGSYDGGLTCADIEGYATGQTTDAVHATIRTKLEALLR